MKDGPFETSIMFASIARHLPSARPQSAPQQRELDECHKRFQELVEIREKETQKPIPNYDAIRRKAVDVLNGVADSNRSVKKHSGLVRRVIGILTECDAFYVRRKTVRA